MNGEGGELHRLIYVSRVARAIVIDFDAECARIVDRSIVNNSRLCITGVLISHEGWFVQALEGERQALLELYECIALDPRHEAARIISFDAVAERCFSAWSMCAGRPPSAAADIALNMNAFSGAVLLTLLQKSVGQTSDYRPRFMDGAAMTILDAMPERQFDDLLQVAEAIGKNDIAVIALDYEAQRWLTSTGNVNKPGLNDLLADVAQRIGAPGVVWIADTSVEAWQDSFAAFGEHKIGYFACAQLAVAGQVVGSLSVAGEGSKAFDKTTTLALEALGRCISARLEARREEQTTASLLASATDAIICVDGSGKITLWNPAAEEMFGYSASEVLGGPMDIIVPERRRAAYNATFEHARKTGWSPLAGRSIEVPALRRDGSEFVIDVALAIWGEGGRMGGGVIVRDCSERKAVEAALAEAKRAAEAANVAKSAFLANMSHEIRTPLNGVIGVTELLVASQLTPQQTEMAELIRSSGVQLHSLLGDILDIARIEAGELLLSLESTSLAEILKSTAELSALRAREKGLFLDLQIDDSIDGPVLADPVRLKQILSNLISNAVKFTDQGGVTLHARRLHPESYEFTVSDTGVGFSPAVKDQIFARFQQADGSITRRFGGTGLGLAICRQLVELMGGTIDCDSTEGDGATFRVRVSFTSAAKSVRGDDIQIAIDEGFPEQKIRILLADDHPINRRVVELILSNLDAEIVSVEDGAQALEAFQAQKFDVVLMDMMMPVMDGLAATRAIRQSETASKRQRTPVLMLTANALPEHITQALACGADQHVAKPITAGTLIGAISDVLNNAAARDVEVA